MPPSEGQKSQAGVVASLRGGRVEECAEPFVDLYLLMKTSLSRLLPLVQAWCLALVNEFTDQHQFQTSAWVFYWAKPATQRVRDTYSSVGLRS